MKFFVLLLLCLAVSGCGSIYINLSDEEKKPYQLETIDLKNHNSQPDSLIYSIDDKQLIELIKESDKDYQLVLLVSLRCYPNQYVIKDMVNYFINDTNVQIFLVAQNDQTDKYLYVNSFKYPGLKRYMLNSELYNLSKLSVMEQSNDARLKLLSEICPGCEIDPGASVALLFNKKGKLLFYPGIGYTGKSWKEGMSFEESLKAGSKYMSDDIRNIIYAQ